MATGKVSLFPVLDRTGNKTLADQIEEHLRAQIMTGAIPVGTELPTIQELVAQTSTSLITIQRVVRDLQSEGLLTSGRGRRLRVRRVTPEIGPAPSSTELRIDRWILPPADQVRLVNGLTALRPAARVVVSTSQPHLCAVNLTDFGGDLGGFVDVTDLVARAYRRNVKDDPFLAALRRDGAIRFLPLSVNTRVVLFNLDLFQRAGERTPDERWSWQDYVECAQRIENKLPGTRGFACDFTMATFLPILWALGGEVFSSDGKQCLLDEPMAHEAVQLCRALARHVDRTVLSADGAVGSAKSFASGQAALCLAGEGGCIRARCSPGLHFGAALPPDGATCRGEIGYGMTTAGAQNPLAWEMLELMADVAAGHYQEHAQLSPLSLVRSARAENDVDRVYLRAYAGSRSVLGNIPEDRRSRRLETAMHLFEMGLRDIFDASRPVEEVLGPLVESMNHVLRPGKAEAVFSLHEWEENAAGVR